jgi:hypothetical protein
MRLATWPDLLRAATVAAVAIALGACGATQPQAPLHYAQALDSATSGISTACGEAYQVTAFPGDHRAELITLEVTASSSARRLADVFARNPAWIYQEETVRQIVHESASMLAACGLGGARDELLRAVARR